MPPTVMKVPFQRLIGGYPPWGCGLILYGCRYRTGDGAELVDLPPLPDPEPPAAVRFLPPWDAMLLVHARRTQILPEEHRAYVFSSKNPHSVCTFLVDGAVAGTWRYERGRIELAEFSPLPGRFVASSPTKPTA